MAGQTAAHLEDGVQVGVLLVSADLVEGEEGQHPARLLPGAPLLQQLLDRERKTDFSVSTVGRTHTHTHTHTHTQIHTHTL